MIINFIYFVFYILLITLVDCYLYGCCKKSYMADYNIPNGIFQSKFFKNLYIFFKKPINWLMEDLKNPKTFIIKIDTRYRYIIQKPLEIGLLILIYFLTHDFGLILAILISHYWLIPDRLFTFFLNREFMIKDINEDPNWLKYFFQSGYWLFQPYSYIKYNLSFILGLIFSIISLLIFNITF